MQILRSWWGMVLLTIIVACSAFLFYTLSIEEAVDTACSMIYEEAPLETIKEQIDLVKDINAVGSKKETVLMTACKMGNVDIIEYLMTKTTINTNKHPDGALTPLELYCEYGYEGGAKGVELLCANGANAKEYTLQEPLYLIARQFKWMNDEQKSKATEVAIELIKNGASLYNEETTILHLTAQADMYVLFYNIIRSTEGTWLMDAKDSSGLTPYEVASKNGAVNVQRAFKTRIDELYIAQGLTPPEVLQSNGLPPDEFFDIDSFLNQYLDTDATSTNQNNEDSTTDDSWMDNTDWGNGIIYVPEGETIPEE